MSLYELDFEKIKNYAGMRIAPVFILTELEHATIHNPPEHDIYKDPIVRKHKIALYGEYCLPMTKKPVRDWLQTLRFKKNPHLRFMYSVLPCGKLIEE